LSNATEQKNAQQDYKPGVFPLKKRKWGEEEPYIKFGPFKIRIPFVHYKFETAEAMQAIFMCATCLGAIPVLTHYLGLSHEVAWAMVIINGFLYFLHASLGDPVVPGWITPGIPLTLAFITTYDMGAERIHALIALQLLVAAIFLLMGITGMARKFVGWVPRPVQAGILLGAGILAVFNEFVPTGRFNLFPITIGIAGSVAAFTLFSATFKSMRAKNRIINKIGSVGMLPAIIVGVIVGPLVGEIPMPQVELGTFIFIPPVGEVMRAISPFYIGFPIWSMFVAALPVAFMLYVIAFGDLITTDALTKDADKARDDEKIDLNANRSNLICGIRNGIMALVAPYPQMSGPIWTAVTAAILNRYKEGRKAMDSVFSGVGTFRMMTAFYIMLFPIASLLRPVLPIALSLTMLVTGFICLSLAMSMCKTDKERSIAGVMGCVLAAMGAMWGLAIGIGLYLLLEKDFVNRQEAIADGTTAAPAATKEDEKK